MSSHKSTERLGRARIILVEDSFPVAHGLQYLLQTVGCDVVGMAGNVETALALIATAQFDVALLDIDLHGEHVAPVADALRQRGKPVIFLSGYDDPDALPPHLQALPRLAKPVDTDELLAVIEQALSTQRA